MTKTKTKYALSAYGPQGEVLAQSYDGGQSWKQTEAGEMFNKRTPEPKVFTRRIAAIADAYTPSSARRIEAPFTRMADVGILAGVMPFEEAMKLADQQMDGIVCPGMCPADLLPQLRRVTKSLILDLDAPTEWTDENRKLLYDTITSYDAVIVPTSLFASRLRPYHDRVFVTPHLLREDLWKLMPQRVVHKKVVIAAPEGMDSVVRNVLNAMVEHYGERIEVRTFDWQALYPGDEVLAYPKFDVVILPQLPDRYQGSLAPILPAFAAGCCVIGDRLWPGLQHNETALTIGKHNTSAWIEQLRRAITDSRHRQRIGRNARTFAYRYTTTRKQADIYLPYRLIVPEGEGMTIA